MMDVLEYAGASHTWVHHPQCTHVRSTSGTRCNQVAGASPKGAVGILQLAGHPNEPNHRPFVAKIFTTWVRNIFATQMESDNKKNSFIILLLGLVLLLLL